MVGCNETFMCFSFSYCILWRDPYTEQMMAVSSARWKQFFARGHVERMLKLWFLSIFKENKNAESSLLPVMFFSESADYFHFPWKYVLCYSTNHKKDVHILIVSLRAKLLVVLLTDCEDGNNNNNNTTYLIQKLEGQRVFVYPLTIQKPPDVSFTH